MEISIMVKKLINDSLELLKERYKNKESAPFFQERDIVWTVQKFMLQELDDNKEYEEYKESEEFKVLNDYPIEISEPSRKNLGLKKGGKRSPRSPLADLVMAYGGVVIAVIEFKYEPNKVRKYSPDKPKEGDMFHSKFPVTSGPAESYDRKRIKIFVKACKKSTGYFIFIDEGGEFIKKEASPASQWTTKDWGGDVAVWFEEFT